MVVRFSSGSPKKLESLSENASQQVSFPSEVHPSLSVTVRASISMMSTLVLGKIEDMCANYWLFPNVSVASSKYKIQSTKNTSYKESG